MPCANRVLRRADHRGAAVHPDFAAVQRVGAEDRPRHFRPAGAHQAGQAEDLTAAQREAHVLDRGAAAQAAHLHHDRVRRGVGQRLVRGGELRPTIIENDGLDRVVAVGTVAMYWPSAHDRHAVGDLFQLVHLVRDVRRCPRRGP